MVLGKKFKIIFFLIILSLRMPAQSVGDSLFFKYCYPELDYYDAIESLAKDSVISISAVSFLPNDYVGVEAFLQFPNLECLTIDGDVGGNLELLCGLSELKVLNYQAWLETFPRCLETKYSLVHLAFGLKASKKFPNLEELNNLQSLIVTLGSPNQLDTLFNQELSSLTYLSVQCEFSVAFSSEKIIVFKNLRELGFVSSEPIRITKEWLEMRSLQRLSVSLDLQDDQSLFMVKQMPKLKGLTLFTRLPKNWKDLNYDFITDLDSLLISLEDQKFRSEESLSFEHFLQESFPNVKIGVVSGNGG